MPDINSLPPSRSTSTRTIPPTSPEAMPIRGQTPSPSPRSASSGVAVTSLQAAAAVNAGLQHETGSRRLSGSSTSSLTGRSRQQGRRRSTVLMNLQLNDPNLPPQAEIASPHSTSGSPIISTGDPHHNRAPSLGEIHQELEQEQEAQVNRLLHMIRTQQQQLQQLQLQAGQTVTQPPTIDDSTPTSDRSMSFPHTAHPHLTSQPSQSPTARTSAATNSRSSIEITRADVLSRSRTPSRTASPRMRATSHSGEGGGGSVLAASAETWNLVPRDESAFYQAETQMLTRENQMLRLRIRELERQVTESNAHAAITHEPATPSNLVRSASVPEEDEGREETGAVPGGGGDAAKDD